MREALQFLSELTHGDLDWLFFAGHERQVIANVQIIIERQYPHQPPLHNSRARLWYWATCACANGSSEVRFSGER
jgi:hypothetical protein